MTTDTPTALTLTIDLFGPLRAHGAEIVVQIPAGADMAAVRAAAALALPDADPQLIADSALAADSRILPPDHLITRADRLALLPPVNGG